MNISNVSSQEYVWQFALRKGGPDSMHKISSKDGQGAALDHPPKRLMEPIFSPSIEARTMPELAIEGL